MKATLRTAFGFACLLGGVVGLGLACTAEVDEPTFNTSTMSATGGTASDTDASSSSGGESSSSTSGMSADAESSTSGPADDTTGTPSSTGPATTGNNTCGDGMISPGEQCDGADLQNFDCASLGLGSGTLSCDPVTCTFDTSMCMNTTTGTSG